MIISTIVGDFVVQASFTPSAEDTMLNRMTKVINSDLTNVYIQVTTEHPELNVETDMDEIFELVLPHIDQASLEHKLYECTGVPGGAFQRVTLDLSNKRMPDGTKKRQKIIYISNI